MAHTPPDFGADVDAPHGTPRWVKVFVLIALVLVLLLVIGLITGQAGPGGHGPSRHTASSDAAGGTPTAELTRAHAPLASAAEDGAQRR